MRRRFSLAWRCAPRVTLTLLCCGAWAAAGCGDDSSTTGGGGAGGGTIDDGGAPDGGSGGAGVSGGSGGGTGGDGGGSPEKFTLTVDKGKTPGLVSGGSIDCGDACSADVDAGTEVTLTAHEEDGFYFQGWGGACSGSDLQCTVVVDADTAVTAEFSQANVMFVTSGSFTIAEIKAQGTGANDTAKLLSGADKICGDEAAAAGLDPNATWRAYVSTTGNPAPSRMAPARGWVRTDGKPAFDALEPGSNPIIPVLYPPSLDAAGAVQSARVLTGTNSDGSVTAAQNCGDFMSTSGAARAGQSTTGGWRWTEDFGVDCDSSQDAHLYCFQIDHTTALDFTPAAGRRAFRSVGLPSGGVGRDAFDALCASNAADAGLDGTYLSFVSTGAESAGSRFDDGEPWVRVDGIQIAPLASDVLTGTGLDAVIDRLASGQVDGESGLVWTGAATPSDIAQSANEDCSDWSASTAGTTGFAGFSTDLEATFAHDLRACSNAFAGVYCLEQ